MPLLCPNCTAALTNVAPQAGVQLRCPFCATSFTISPQGMALTSVPTPAEPQDEGESGQMWKLLGLGGVLGLILIGMSVFFWQLVMRHRASRPVPNTPVVSRTEQREREPEIEEPPPPPVRRRTDDDMPTIPIRDPRGSEPDLAVPNFAEFMGIRAQGKRFCIIADVSGSMVMHDRISRLKKELVATLENLHEQQEYYVIFFSDGSLPMNENSWQRGGKKNIARHLNWINSQQAFGGTIPDGAFRLALSLNPRPDVIFFMTDGLIPQETPRHVRLLNEAGSSKTVVHTIMVGEEISTDRKDDAGRIEEEVKALMKLGITRAQAQEVHRQLLAESKLAVSLLEQIAKDSGGTFRYAKAKLK